MRSTWRKPPIITTWPPKIGRWSLIYNPALRRQTSRWPPTSQSEKRGGIRTAPTLAAEANARAQA